MSKYLFVFCFLSIFSANAQQHYTPPPENLAQRQWFDSARFGMFIHWGASSVLGHGEWVMNNRNIQVKEYQRLQNIPDPMFRDQINNLVRHTFFHTVTNSFILMSESFYERPLDN